MEDEVPFDLKEDILCRLPVKSVVRFKGVCKRWLLLTKDPKLIKLHLQRSTRSHTKGSLVSVSLEDNQLCSVDLSTLHITKAAINPLSKLPNLIYLAGACNGLLCFSTWDGNTITLWNMSTKDHKILPPLDPDEYGIQDQRLQLVGFGYDPCNDDYKVVRVYYCSTKGHIAIFYSLRLNSWGSNYEDEYEYHNFRQFYFWSWAVYVSGALNWIARTNNTTNHNEVHSTIIGLDLNTENARDLRFPYKPNDPLLFLIDSIGVLDGKLCAAGRKNGQEEVIDIWVMEEYGKEESWKILFSIDVNGGVGIPSTSFELGTSYVFKPLIYYHCGKEDGNQVLLLLKLHALYHGELLSYNFKEEKLSHHGCIPHFRHAHIWLHHESLVPINQD